MIPWAVSVNATVPSPVGAIGLEKVNVGSLSTSITRPSRAGSVDRCVLQDAEVGGVGDDPHELDRDDAIGGIRAIADGITDMDRAGGFRGRQGVGKCSH